MQERMDKIPKLSKRILYGGGMIALLVLALICLESWVISLPSSRKIKALRVQLYLGIGVIMLICSGYIWRRINALQRSRHPFDVGTLFKCVMLILLVLSQVAVACILFLVQTDPPRFSFVATFSLGCIIILTFCLIVTDIFSFICQKIICRKNQTLNSLNKTEVKIRFLLSLISTLILVTAGTVCVNQLAIEEISVPIKGLSPRLNGIRIIQISDIHLGPFNGKQRLSTVVQKVNELEGDIVALTGDLVDSSVSALREAVSPLKNLQAKDGVFYITGNHEYYTGDVDNWIAEIPKLNITPLLNQRVCLHPRDKSSCTGGLYLAGLEDIATRLMKYGSHSMDLHAALSGRTPRVPTVVLAHQPRAAQEAMYWTDVRLVLSGHTHAGQILPFMPFVYLLNPFFVGLYEPRPDTYVYVNPGTVYYLVPFRHYRPEITVLTLISS